MANKGIHFGVSMSTRLLPDKQKRHRARVHFWVAISGS
jgi:hypothetical protein